LAWSVCPCPLKFQNMSVIDPREKMDIFITQCFSRATINWRASSVPIEPRAVAEHFPFANGDQVAAEDHLIFGYGDISY